MTGPVADFHASPLSGVAPLTVTFTNTTSGTVDAYLWEFGNGATSEVTDPIHVEKGEACCPEICSAGLIELDQCISLGCYYLNPDWWKTGFDEPGDWSNVEFGVKLYDTCGGQLTYEQFQNSLATRGHWLTRAPQIPEWNWINPKGGWPYETGRFDGPSESQYELPIQLLLMSW